MTTISAAPPSPNGGLKLGALVRHGDRMAYVIAVSHPSPFQVSYLDGEEPRLRDYLLESDLEVIDDNPVADERIPASVRDWFKAGKRVSMP